MSLEKNILDYKLGIKKPSLILDETVLTEKVWFAKPFDINDYAMFDTVKEKSHCFMLEVKIFADSTWKNIEEYKDEIIDIYSQSDYETLIALARSFKKYDELKLREISHAYFLKATSQP